MFARGAQSAVDDLVTTLFPGDCRVCDGPLTRAGLVPVCDACLRKVHPQDGLLCATCGELLGMEDERFAEGFGREAPRCTPCRRLAPEFTRAVAYGVYEGELRELLQLLKYERVRGLERPLGAMLAQAIDLLDVEIQAAGSDLLVVAVPMFRAKQRERGFNHAQLLADAALRELKRRRPEWKLRSQHGAIDRVRATESQFGLSARARRLNLRDAFAVVDPDVVARRTVLLIDDIYTTGATARVCARALQQAGASAVLVATLARAQVEAVAMWDAGAGRSVRLESFGQVQTDAGGTR